MNRQLATMVTRLKQIKPGDIEIWGHVAHDTAGVFSAWAKAARDAGQADLADPLDAAARATRQLSQQRRWAITGRKMGRGTGMTGAAQLVQQFTTTGVGKAIFLRQLVDTLFALHQAGTANRQARIATAAVVREDLNRVIATFPPSPSKSSPAYGAALTVA